TDRVHVAPQTADQVDQAVGGCRGRLAAAGEAFARPELLAGCWVVADHRPLAVEDQVLVFARLPQARRAPAAVRGPVPRRLPYGFAILPVYGEEVRLVLGVAILNDQVAKQDRASAGAPRPVERPQVGARPEVLAVGVVAVQTALAEERDHPLAVGAAAGRRPAVHRMPLLRLALPGALLPEDFTVALIDAEDDALLAFLQRRGQENALAPDDGRRLAASGQRRLPHDRLRVPLDGDSGFGRVAGAVRSAPARP